MKKKIVFICIFFVLFIVLAFQRVRIQFVDELYVRLFKKSMIFNHFNNKGELDGDYISYLNGQVYLKSHFKDGSREGLCVWYNEKTGKEQHEIFYKKGKAEGKEYQYYDNGNLNYNGFWKNDKRYGSLYWYSTNGKLETYTAYDISGNAFLVCHYDKFGHIVHMSEIMICPTIYSLDVTTDSTILLKNNDTTHKLKDLYVTVATPPGLKPRFNIAVNGVAITNYKIDNNTIIIKNIFLSKGNWIITFDSEFLNEQKRLIRSPRFEYGIISD